VIVGLSGGVDSSVAALLLLEQGYDVQGLFMKNWEDDDRDGVCGATVDLEDAKRVCLDLEIPLHKVNFAQRYRERVFAHFLAEYRGGRTPNPDVLCNREIKFRAFLDHARGLGADFIATGHYARTASSGNEDVRLLRGIDAQKDQSYFLYALDQAQLAPALFPLGGLEKPTVRDLARAAGLHTADRKDSTGICFIGERRFRTFLQRYLPVRPGPMLTPEGERIGEHLGLMYYTLGQRQGLGIGGRADGDGRPWFVADKRLGDNVLVVVQGGEHPLLRRDTLSSRELTWISRDAPAPGTRLSAKIRYRQTDQSCRILRLGRNRCVVGFEQPQRAVTPGQSIVFYDQAVCLGGGVIQTAWNRGDRPVRLPMNPAAVA
jgi:tRNA-specific 2-thiouridylase